jgi:transmembrane sensor
VNKERLIALISKQLVDEISEKESLELSQLLSNPANKDFYEDIKKKWLTSSYFRPDIQPDIDKSWELFVTKSNLPTLPTRNNQRWIVLYWKHIAAIFVAGLIISYLYRTLTVTSAEYVTQKGQQKDIVLPDGTQVKLMESSTLTYETDFGRSTRVVALSGSGYFDVVRDSVKPFVIQNQHATVSVLGTSFQVSTYPMNDYVEVNVQSGKVSLVEKVTLKEVILTRGMTGKYRILDNALTAQTIADDRVDIQFAGVLKFNDTALRDVLKQLQVSFGKEFALLSEKAASCKFTGTFDSPYLQEVLEILSASLDVHFTPQGDRFMVEGNGCH